MVTVADLDHAAKSEQGLLVDLVLAQQFRVVEKSRRNQPSFHIALGVQ